MFARLTNFLCVAVMAMAILADYHVSEQTRVAAVQLKQVVRKVTDERSQMAVLQAKWEEVAAPARIQALAESKLGMNDSATLQLSALEALPRNDAGATTSGPVISEASAIVPATPLKLTDVSDRAGQ
jgi:cell division protein FtsL